MQQAIGMNDTPDLVFADWARTEMPMGRFSDRALVRTYADDNLDLFAWLEKHGVKWEAYRPKPDRLDRSRTRLNCFAWPNEATNPRARLGLRAAAGADRAQDGRRHPAQAADDHDPPRAADSSGRVTGITAIEVDDWFKPTGKSINIRARKGVIVATGGCADNVEFRTMFDVRLTEEYQAENSGWSKRTADGEIAAMQIGAALGATACQTTRGRQPAQQGPHGHEVERRRDRDPSDRAAYVPRARRRARGARLSERHPGEGERAALP